MEDPFPQCGCGKPIRLDPSSPTGWTHDDSHHYHHLAHPQLPLHFDTEDV